MSFVPNRSWFPLAARKRLTARFPPVVSNTAHSTRCSLTDQIGGQETEAVESLRNRVVAWEACVLLALLAIVAAMGRGLWSPDELKYAQVVQAMQSTGKILVPHLWGEVYADKPPLFFWLVLISSRLFGGVGLASLLAPLVCAACAGVWLVSHIATCWSGQRAGMLAAIVLVSLPLYVIGAQIGRMDMLLTLAITAATHLFHLGYVEDRRWAKVAAFGVMGLGVLAKGPFGVLLPLGVGGGFLAITRRLGRLCCTETIAGIGLAIVIVAMWLVPATAIEGPNYLRMLLGENTLNAAVSGLDHPQPVYFYSLMLPVLLVPWIVSFVPAIRAEWQRWRERGDERSLWLLCWLLIPLLVLSLVKLKLVIYLLPLMPPVAIVLARYWVELIDRTAADRARPAFTALFTAEGLVGLMLIAGGLLQERDGSGLYTITFARTVRVTIDGPIGDTLVNPTVLLSGGCIVAVFGLAGMLLNRPRVRHRMAGVFGLFAAGAPCAAVFGALLVLPKMDASQSWRGVAEQLADVRRPGEPVITYQLRPFVGYYFASEVADFEVPEKVAQLVERHRSVWCAVRVQGLAELGRHCVVDYDPAAGRVSPKGIVQIAHLRPLSSAERTER